MAPFTNLTRAQDLAPCPPSCGPNLTQAGATAKAIESLAAAMSKGGGRDASALRVAEQYISAFGKLAQGGNTLVVPANTADVGSMVAQAQPYPFPSPKAKHPSQTLNPMNSEPDLAPS